MNEFTKAPFLAFSTSKNDHVPLKRKLFCDYPVNVAACIEKQRENLFIFRRLN